MLHHNFMFEKPTSSSRIKVFIVDDSSIQPKSQQKIKLLGKVYDYIYKKFIVDFMAILHKIVQQESF